MLLSLNSHIGILLTLALPSYGILVEKPLKAEDTAEEGSAGQLALCQQQIIHRSAIFDNAVVTNSKVRELLALLMLKVGEAELGQPTGSFLLDSLLFPTLDLEIVREGHIIFPNKKSLKGLLEFCRSYRWLNVSESDLGAYVSFTRFASDIDKLSCDWCALVNGIVELVLAKMKHVQGSPNVRSIEFPNQEIPIWFRKVENATRDLKLYKDFDSTPSAAQRNEYKNLPPSATESVLGMRNTVAAYESRWCPFRHLQALNFTRDYYCFAPDVQSDLEHAQDILRRKKQISGEDITCDECNKAINDEWGSRTPHIPSAFDARTLNGRGPSYMDRVKEAFGIPSFPDYGTWSPKVCNSLEMYRYEPAESFDRGLLARYSDEVDRIRGTLSYDRIMEEYSVEPRKI